MNDKIKLVLPIYISMFERINEIKHKPFMSEAEATTFFLQQCRRHYWQDWDLDKIPDIGNVQKKYDIEWCFRWKSIAIEMKICKTLKECTYDRTIDQCLPHQIVNLEKRKIAWWLSIVWCYHKELQKFYFRKFI